MTNNKVKQMRVSSKTDINGLAGAITAAFTQEGFEQVDLSVIGAGANWQASKAVATATGYLAPSGYSLLIRPKYKDIEIENEKKTSLNLTIVKVAS